MSNRSRSKKYNIVDTIIDDAPFGDINWCTISFLTPQRNEELTYLDAKGFKIHAGYNTIDVANDDAKKIKIANSNHDVFVSQMGKLYAWDDATRTDEIEYDNDKLNNLEKTRRENVDKIRLMSEQFKNETSAPKNNTSDRLQAQKRQIQRKLYERGLITQQEYEIAKNEQCTIREVKNKAEILERLATAVKETEDVDYLDENPPIALKFGCLSIYSPKVIGGLSTLCFKVRGLFQTQSELVERNRTLQRLYPNDKVYNFEIGKWCSFSETGGIDEILLSRQLNYAMKLHLESIKTEEEKFMKRKVEMEDQAKQDTKIKQQENRREKRRARKAAKKSATKTPTESSSPTPSVPSTIAPAPEPELDLIGDEDDAAAIQKMIEFLEDPVCKDRFVSAIHHDAKHSMEVAL